MLSWRRSYIEISTADQVDSDAQILRHGTGASAEFRGIARDRGPARITRLLAGVGRPSTTYEPRRAADGVIYQVVRDHYETFVAQAASFRVALVSGRASLRSARTVSKMSPRQGENRQDSGGRQ
jgi:hypothetical protein